LFCRLTKKQPGDESIPRPWSRYSQGSSAYYKTHNQQPKTFNKEDTIDDIFTKAKGKGVTEDEKNSDSRKRKREAEDAGENPKKIKREGKKEYENLQDDPQFKEYMKIMSKNPKFWANDDGVVEEGKKTESRKRY
jgi:hypothetical protein